MAVPGVITNSARALMDVGDYVMITGLRSPEAQAAVLPAQMYLWSFIVLGVGVVSMANTFAAQSLGRGQPRECAAYGWQTLYISAVFGVLALGFYPFLPALFAWIGHEPGVQAMELAYARIGILNVGPTVASFGLAAFFTGIHRPKAAMWTVLEANAVNVVVSLVLMFGWLGFPAMGIVGAAWGTLIATVYRVVRLAGPMLGASFDAEFHSRAAWKPSWKHCSDLFRVGLPVGFHWLSEVFVWALFVGLLVGKFFGTADLIATTAAWQYMRIAFLPTVGVGQALTALVGKSIGAGEPHRAIRETRFCVGVTLAYMSILSVVYWLAGRWLIGLFNADPEVLDIGGKIMICTAIFQLFDALAITYASALRGAGDTFVPAVFMTVSLWVVVIGAGWWIAVTFSHLRSVGPWLAASLLIVITGVYMWHRWNGGAWRRISLWRKEPKPPPTEA